MCCLEASRRLAVPRAPHAMAEILACTRAIASVHRNRRGSEFSSTTLRASISRAAGLPRFPSMARLVATISLWWASTVAAYEHGTSTGIDGWLEDHNYFRCLHNAEPVSWDYGLEAVSYTHLTLPTNPRV